MKFPTLRSPAPLAAACAWTLFLAPCARACAQATQVQPAPAQAAPAQQADRSERWYSVEMMGGKAGWMQSITIRAADTITTRTKIHFSLARGVEGADITIASEFVETPAGKAVSMRTVQKMGLMDVEQNYRFLEDGVEVTSKQAGKSSTTKEALPKGEWMTPDAADKFVRAAMSRGEKKVRVTSLDPMEGLTPATATYEGFEETTIDLDGVQTPAVRATSVIEGKEAAHSVQFSDKEGELLRTETTIGGISVVMSKTTRERARAAGDAPKPEVMLKTFIKPDVVVHDPRGVREGVYELSVKEGDMPALPETGAQSVEKLDGARCVVRVSAAFPHTAPAKDLADKALLASSAMADTSDEKLIEFVRTALKDAPADKATRAERLRRAVYAHIREKNLGVGMGTASEVVRTREGDCSEHGVLLAAALRVDGIPSRVASGLLYAEQFAGGKDIFGYHMWAQALLGEGASATWVDVDGTFPPDMAFDATHIALGVSDLSDGGMNDSLLNLASILGNTSIKVREVKHAEGGK